MWSVSRRVLLLWVTTTSLARAEERFELTPFWGLTSLDARAPREPGGVSLPFAERFEHGFQLGARFGARFGDRIALETEYRYGPNGKFVVGFEDRFLGGVALEVPTDVASHALTGGVLFDVTQSERWRPFVGAAVGVEHFRTGGGETTLRTALGGGVRFSVHPRVGVRIDTRYVVWPSFFLTDELESGLEIDAGLTFGF